MPRIPIPLQGSHQIGRANAASALECINMYQETSKVSKNKVSLYPTPGLLALVSAGIGPCRGNGEEFDGNAYFVSGSKLIKIDSSFTASEVGTLTTSTGSVSMASSSTQLLIVDGADGYIWDGTTFTTISDIDFPRATVCAYMDTYFIVNDEDSPGVFNISATDDGLVWGALDFGISESSPGALKNIKVIHNTLFLFSSIATEPFYNSGNADFPFEPLRNSKIESGLQASFSVVQADNTLYWLGANKEGVNQFIRLNGYNPEVVSTREIEYELSTYSRTSDCTAYSYQQAGHVFVVFSFPAQDRTLVYDISENTWHRRKAFDMGRHRGEGHLSFNGKHIIGDHITSQFYELSLGTYTDTSALSYIERQVITGHVHDQGSNITVHCLEVDFAGGEGVLTGQGSDPTITLYYSKDEGNTWSTGLQKALGAMGQYRKRARFFGLGMGENFVFKLVVTDPIKLAIVGMYLTYHVLDFYKEKAGEEA